MQFWNGKQILVTGAGGFIGSHLVEALVDANAQVRAFVRYNSRADWGLLSMLPEEKLASVEIIAGDFRDLSAVRQAMRGVSHVFHLGALIAIPYSYLHPAEVVETNVIGTLNILLAGRDLGVERIIHTSTSEVYGTALRVPIDESHPLQGQSPYSASKIGADKIAESFYRSYDLPIVTVRPFNTYGPRQSTRAVIPTIITQALQRDVIAEVPGIEGDTFNLGVGADISIGELAQKIIALTGSSARIEIDPTRLRPEKSEVKRLLSDNSRARKYLGWQPQVDLDEGLRRTIAWMKEHLARYENFA